MYEAYALVQKAIEKEPKEGCFGAHKWYAILLDYIGEIEGNKSRIQKSYEVKEHLERALQICSSDATTWHILDTPSLSVSFRSFLTLMMSPPAGKEPKVNELPPNFSFTRDDPFYFGPATCNLMHYTPAAYMAGFVEMTLTNNKKGCMHKLTRFRIPEMERDFGPIWPFNIGVISFFAAALCIW
ncbi:hypothetical protein ANCCEY_14704 [Ancylostoma ceylanicum]|uniref:Uncharacterized protein n=1 Tax=Ancylostoma ceylanicum TaxID=53326 RepID=A0A0D6L4M5_9BILA|nr:hypothetical protein ANCCEY_14704 [Ancylostoma ceylanicum]